VARKALKGRWHWVVAVLAFVALFAFNVPFPVVIIAAAVIGWVMGRGTPQALTAPLPPGATAFAARQIATWGAVWLVPLGALWLLDGGLLWQLGLFFSKLAVVTFGGAYAVLAWMTQEVVQVRGWLTTEEMIAGLGLAETTPGPLILVNEFVGYLAAWKQGGIAYGIAGAVTAIWMTFAPCFLWIFAGAPFVERLAGQPRLSAALGGITAAVVGVIANLSLWFALHMMFGTVDTVTAGPLRLAVPDPATLDAVALGLAAVAGWMILRRHMDLILVLAIMAAASVALSLATG
jgi:chromate transporter